MERCIDFKDGRFILSFPFQRQLNAEIKTIPSWQYDSETKTWSFPNTLISLKRFVEIARIYKFVGTPLAQQNAKDILSAAISPLTEGPVNLDVSRLATDKNLYPFQIDGAKFLLKEKRAILGDEPGVGKTPQSLAAVASAEAFPLLVICPTSLKVHWEREAESWIPGVKVRILDDKVLSGRFKDVNIISYGLVQKHLDVLKHKKIASIIVDESHYIKSRDSKRSVATRSLVDATKPEYVFLLSGTPVLNRPVELMPQLQAINRLADLGGATYFAKQYCGAVRVSTKRHGWITSLHGATNLAELNTKLRTTGVYLRRTKEEVYPEMPEKQLTIYPVEMDGANRAIYRRIERELISWLRENYGENRANSALRAQALVKINYLRQQVGKGKLVAEIAWIKDFLENDLKLVVFADHRDVQQKLLEEFKSQAVHVFGSDKANDRQKTVDKYQNDASIKLFLGSLSVARLGFSLTAAHHVSFVELGWTPEAHDQAEGRLHRRGQTNTVNSYYFLASNTIDDYMWQLLNDKQRVVDMSLDGEQRNTKVTVFDRLIDMLMNKKV